MNATVDRKTCSGCGTCAKQCSDVFQIVGGKAAVGVVHIPWYLESASMHVSHECPEGAIHIGEAHGLMMAETGSDLRSWIAL